MVFRRALAATACTLCAACTPSGFPDNPFVAAEQSMTAPDIVPLETGFPGAEDLAQAREAEVEAFSLHEEAEALRTRTTALTARDPARSEDELAPSAPAAEVQARSADLRARAADLRAREDIGQTSDATDFDIQRQELDAEAENLRTRTD